jgi:hypothetical protein
MRISRIDKRPQSVTFIDEPQLGRSLLRHWLSEQQGDKTESSPAEYFLNGSITLREPATFNGVNFVDLSNVSPRTFSKQLGILLNTFYEQLASPRSYVGNLPTNLTMYGNETFPAAHGAAAGRDAPKSQVFQSPKTIFSRLGIAVSEAHDRGMPFINFAAKGTATGRTEVFVCQFQWLAVLLLAAGTLFVMGVASLVLSTGATLPPDMLRFVASMTYANAHFSTPPGATALDAIDRARLLRDVRVRIGDIRGDDDNIGEVAFVAADEVKVRPLDYRRLYS